MGTIHDFTTPRNLFEKLRRDSERIDKEINGDNFFNFMATAYRLQSWIKKSPMGQHETIKRLLRKASRDPFVKNCCAILEGKKQFIIQFDKKLSNPELVIGDERYDPIGFKDKILLIFESYFSTK